MTAGRFWVSIRAAWSILAHPPVPSQGPGCRPACGHADTSLCRHRRPDYLQLDAGCAPSKEKAGRVSDLIGKHSFKPLEYLTRPNCRLYSGATPFTVTPEEGQPLPGGLGSHKSGLRLGLGPRSRPDTRANLFLPGGLDTESTGRPAWETVHAGQQEAAGAQRLWPRGTGMGSAEDLFALCRDF